MAGLDQEPHDAPVYTSPFPLHVHDIETLTQSDGFLILRNHLAEHYHYEFCSNHNAIHRQDRELIMIIRDSLHALLVPVVELFDKACSIASHATRATKLADLEYAFHDQARSAFVWLQCYLSSEQERAWCYTRGCPACVVHRTFDSEFSIRLLYAACLLSDVHYPFTLDGPTLPSFMFLLESLHYALQHDPLYGAEFFELVRPKAVATRNGIEDLIHQCLELDLLLSQPSSPDASTPDISQPSSPVIGPMGGRAGMKVRRSKLARRQMRMRMEQELWVEEMLRHCSEQLQPGERSDAELTKKLSTCMSDEICVPQSLNAILHDDGKAEYTISVTEFATDG